MRRRPPLPPRVRRFVAVALTLTLLSQATALWARAHGLGRLVNDAADFPACVRGPAVVPSAGRP